MRNKHKRRRQAATDFNSATAVLTATAICLAAYALAIGGCIALAG